MADVSSDSVRCARLASAADYSFTAFNVPGLTNTVATGINASLAIVGYGTNGNNVTTGFLLSAGHVTTIFVPGSTSTKPSGLNDSEQIVGTYINASGSHGFEYSSGTYTTIDAPTLDSKDGLTFAAGTTNLTGISNAGKIIGTVTTVGEPFFVVTFTDSAATFQFYYFGTTYSTPIGISASGDFALYYGGLHGPYILNVYYTSTSSPTSFINPLLGGGISGINDEYQIAGAYLISVPPGSTSQSPVSTGPAIAFPGAASTYTFGLNNADWLVGGYVDNSQVSHAFVMFAQTAVLPDTPEPLIVKSSGLCLDVQGASQQPGVPTLQNACNGSAGQQWQAVAAADGSIELVVQSDGYSLDVAGKSTYPGASVVQWPYHDGANEHWYFQPTPDGYFKLVSQNSLLCLDLVGGTGATPEALTEQNTCNNSDSQKWSFGSSRPIPTTFTQLVVKSTGMCLDVQGQSLDPGAPAIQWPCRGAANQLWKPSPSGDGFYEIAVQLTGFSLDVNGKSTEPGAPVLQWPYQDGSNEHWNFQRTSDGYYNLVNQNSGLCLDITGGASAPAGALTEQNTCDGADNQKWSFVAP